MPRPLANLPLLPFLPPLPTLLALLAYFEARTDLTQDLRTLTALIRTLLIIRRLESNGKLNPFFQLESVALNPTFSDKPFILFEGQTYTYSQAYATILRHGAWLQDRFHISRDEIVAINFYNKPAFIWFWFGLWSIGAKVAFINYNLTGESLIHCIKISKARLVLIDDEVLNEVLFKNGGTEAEGKETLARIKTELTDGEVTEGKYTQREVIIFDQALETVVNTWAKRRADDKTIGFRKIGEMGVLIYTSGTTGLPKAASVSFSKVFQGATFAHRYIRLKPTDIFYTCMPLYHTSAAVLGLCAVMQAPATFSLGKKFSHKTFWPTIHATHSTILQYVGETCRYLLAAPPSSLDTTHSVRLAFGNGLRPEIWEKFRTRFHIPTIVEFYASTEGQSATWNYNTGPHGSGAVGRFGLLVRTFTHFTSRIVKFDYTTCQPARDPKTNLCIPAGANEPGELLWKLDPADITASFQGYFSNPTATSSKILRNVFRSGDAWFRTGDIMSQDASTGYLYFIDRIGDTYRWKSENISTSEISELFSQFRNGEDFVDVNVYGVAIPGYDGRAGCVAICPKIESNSLVDSQAWFDELSTYVRTRFAGFKIPCFVRVVRCGEGGLEKTGTNKYVKEGLKRQGVEPEVLEREASGDKVWFWRGTEEGYRPFGKREWDEVVGGRVKL